MSRFFCHHGIDTDQATCVQCDIEHMKRKPLGNANSPAASMTLREHYAGLAMQSFISQDFTFGRKQNALDAVNAADALIAELAKTPAERGEVQS